MSFLGLRQKLNWMKVWKKVKCTAVADLLHSVVTCL
jgi:hypothetical protein